MKKFLPYILILTIILQIFAPFTIGSGVNNNLEIQTNKAEAEDCKILEEFFTSPYPNSTDATRPQEVTYNIVTSGCIGNNIMLSGVARGTYSQAGIFITNLQIINSDVISFTLTTGEQYCSGGDCNKIEFSSTIGNPEGQAVASKKSNTSLSFKCDNGSCSDTKIWSLKSSTGVNSEATTQTLNELKEEQTKKIIDNPLDCSITNLKGCVAMVPYYLLFVPTSAIFSISGEIFDFAFGYSVQDSSYRSTFVIEGWGIIRDFCNMFFIFILLYIAFGTILNLNSVKTKEMIINVVIIGLLINFSLFATHLIIDASNILARVFYNSETIKITEKNPDGSSKETEQEEYIKLSEAIVSKINPQELLLQAGTVGNIPDKGGMSEEMGAGEIGLGTLVLIILLASAVNIIGTIVFISVALIFVGRVIGLWLSMIFVPFAFFTYAVPSLQDLDMVGWKKWWPETIKMAFLAPVFIFFMYLIIKFLNLKLDLINTAGKSGMDFVVALLLPFAFIMILLWKAKQIAAKMSGTIGEMASKAGAAIGGVGLAVATGGAAMAMRGTLGRMGSSVANKKWLANAEAKGGIGGWLAKQTRNAGTGIGKSSFDVRATKLGASAAKSMGVEGSIGKAKEGGFAKYKSEQIDNRKKRAQELKEAATSKEKDDVLIAQAELDKEKNAPGRQQRIRGIKEGPAGIKFQEGQLAKAERDLKDLVDKGEGASAAADAVRSYRQTILNEITTLKSTLKLEEGPIEAAQAKLEDAQNVLINAGRTTLEAYSKSIQSGFGNTINTIFSLGQETKAANEQAAREILANLPQEK